MTDQTKQIIVPFLKWAGGKRWLIRSCPSLFDIPFERYFEPFLGSGAVFFYIQPANAILSDSNQALIETYQAIKDDWQKVAGGLKNHQKNHSKDYYYLIRDQKMKSPYERAAKLIYLNRTCWNGLFRVNQNGWFNVPIGTKTDVALETDDFEAVANLLQTAELICSDFENIIDRSKGGDLLFIDPPYTVKHDDNGFIKYNEKLFNWDDQVRLRDAVLRAKERGVRVILTNANNSSIRNLYKKYFDIRSFKRSSVLSGKSEFRGTVRELIIMG